MTDFIDRFWKTATPYKRAHVALKEFSRKGDAEVDSIKVVESASFGILLKNASDIHGARRERLSAPESQSAELLLDQESVVLSAIGLARDDIAGLAVVKRGVDKKYTFKMQEKNGFVAPVINNGADDDAVFSHAAWEKQRLDALDEALRQGANIVCFGENDFTPTSDLRQLESHCKKIQARIDALERPVFVVAGTTHDHDDVNQPATCFNQARIFVNDAIKTFENLEIEEPIKHKKLSPAEHADEAISTPESPRVTYYDTVMGRIAVLICVDAYNPTVLMSLLGNRATRGHEQIDYVLVPAYNDSPKLYYSCQVLSLVSGSVVMLVDACSKSSKDAKPAETAIFIHGRLFSDLVTDDALDEPVGEYLSPEPHAPVRTCRVSLDYLRELRAQDHPATPFLNQVSDIFAKVQQRGT